MPKTITVTAEDISQGVPGNCFSCPVALAMERAYGNDCCGANVYSSLDGIRVEVFGQSTPAPPEVIQFVLEFDKAKKLKRPKFQPFTFDLPDDNDPAWHEKCYECEELFPTAQLDDDALCKSCAAKLVR